MNRRKFLKAGIKALALLPFVGPLVAWAKETGASLKPTTKTTFRGIPVISSDIVPRNELWFMKSLRKDGSCLIRPDGSRWRWTNGKWVPEDSPEWWSSNITQAKPLTLEEMQKCFDKAKFAERCKKSYSTESPLYEWVKEEESKWLKLFRKRNTIQS